MAQNKLQIPTKSFSANSVSVASYEMDTTKTVGGSHGYMFEFFQDIKDITGPKMEGGVRVFYPLQSLVINCHGAPAKLRLGLGELNWANIDIWKHLRYDNDEPRVRTIYLVSCNVVSFTGKSDGNLFCGAIAKNANAYVIASDEQQKPSACPKGFIDQFEGDVWEWLPGGANRKWDGVPKVR